MEALDTHPAEGGQQGVVQHDGHISTGTRGRHRRHPVAGQEMGVEEDQGDGQIDVELHGHVCVCESEKDRLRGQTDTQPGFCWGKAPCAVAMEMAG